LSRFSINLKENRLREIFRFRSISQNVQGGHVDQPMVPFKNHRERICITRLKVPHYALVIERKEIGIRRTLVAVAGTNS